MQIFLKLVARTQEVAYINDWRILLLRAQKTTINCWKIGVQLFMKRYVKVVFNISTELDSIIVKNLFIYLFDAYNVLTLLYFWSHPSCRSPMSQQVGNTRKGYPNLPRCNDQNAALKVIFFVAENCIRSYVEQRFPYLGIWV